MKRVFFFLAVSIIAIVCMAVAGCIDTDDQSTSIVEGNGLTLKSEQEREYNGLINIINNPTEKYEIKKETFNKFSFDEGTFQLWVFVSEIKETQIVKTSFVVSSAKYIKLPNAIGIPEGQNYYNYFVKDSSISVSYYVEIKEIYHDGSRFNKPYVFFLTPNDYDELLDGIEQYAPKDK